jgi:thiazole synthase
LPDNYQTAKACEILIKKTFMNAYLYVARDIQNAEATAVVPLGSPIGTN